MPLTEQEDGYKEWPKDDQSKQEDVERSPKLVTPSVGTSPQKDEEDGIVGQYEVCLD